MAIIGNTKAKILQELGGQKMHGYLLAKEAGVPVTGIYQHLRQLRREGLVDFELVGRRKTYFLTRRGRNLLEVLSP